MSLVGCSFALNIADEIRIGALMMKTTAAFLGLVGFRMVFRWAGHAFSATYDWL
jgi:hypothetical protein